jgi:hypothetical protein
LLIEHCHRTVALGDLGCEAGDGTRRAAGRPAALSRPSEVTGGGGSGRTGLDGACKSFETVSSIRIFTGSSMGAGAATRGRQATTNGQCKIVVMQ